jgi:hypothetical protein
MPPQPERGRKRRQDRKVLNSMIYRLKTGCRYRDIPRTSHYAPPTTTHCWLTRWTQDGFITRLWQHLLSLLEQAGGLDLSRGGLDGSFVSGKRWATESQEPLGVTIQTRWWSAKHSASPSASTWPQPNSTTPPWLSIPCPPCGCRGLAEGGPEPGFLSSRWIKALIVGSYVVLYPDAGFGRAFR